MFPDKVFTKLYLEHILYPIRGAAFPQPNQDTNHPLSGMNNFQYFEYNTKKNPLYGVKEPLDSFQVAYNKGTSSKAASWPLQSNITGLLHICNTFHYVCC